MASEYLKWKYRDVRPNEKVELTEKQRRQNWWHYHKWHILVGIILILIVANLIWNYLSQVHPDYQIAYVGAYPLSDEDAAAWEERLTALGMDCNGDGRIVVQLNQYVSGGSDLMYTSASNVKLMADLESNESYFFLLEDPEAFQTNYEVLQGDWFQLENGLFLARRDFWEHRVPEHMTDCVRLWDELAEKRNP